MELVFGMYRLEDRGMAVVYYHGSNVGGLKELKPFLSEHGKSYVYFSLDPLVALLYAVKPVPKPFSFYPYGFDGNGRVVYTEYYAGALSDLYQGRKGYLYECEGLTDMENPTQITCARVCTGPAAVARVTEIPDLYGYYKEREKKGDFIVKPFEQVSAGELSFVRESLKEDMRRYGLRDNPGHAMSLFIKTHFPEVWAD